MYKVVGVIPARYKSSRFPGKPLADILGMPMIWWVYQNAKKVEDFDEVYVATDDMRIKSKCDELGIKVIMTSCSHPTGTDRIAEVAKKIKADFYVNIQGDEPLVDYMTIKKAIIEGKEVTNLMTEIIRKDELDDPTVPKVVVNENNEAVFLSRYPIPYPKNSGAKYYKQVCVYGFSPKSLEDFSKLKRGRIEQYEDIELLRFIENKIPVAMVEVYKDTVAVDVPSDLEKAINKIKKEKFESIIFDFDGVLVQSEKIKSDAFKRLFREYGIEDQVNIKIGGKSRYEKIRYHHKKFLNNNLNEKELNDIAQKYSDLTKKAIIEAPFVDGAYAFLENNYKIIDLYVVSGTPQDELEEIIKNRKMTKYFKKIYGAFDEKHNIITSIIKNYNKEKVVYIGDTKSDFESAKKAGVYFIGVGNVFPEGIYEISDEIWRRNL